MCETGSNPPPRPLNAPPPPHRNCGKAWRLWFGFQGIPAESIIYTPHPQVLLEEDVTHAEACEDVEELQRFIYRTNLYSNTVPVLGRGCVSVAAGQTITAEDATFMLLVFAPVMRRKIVPGEMLECAARLHRLEGEDPSTRRLVRKVREHLLTMMRLECCGHPQHDDHNHKPSCVGLLSAPEHFESVKCCGTAPQHFHRL